MNSELTRVFLALFVFAGMLIGLSCGREDRADNRSVGTTADTADAPDADRSALCPQGATFQTKKENIEGYIDRELLKLEKLRQQKGQGFDYAIVPVTQQQLLEIRVDGFLRGSGKQETAFEDFLDIIDGLMTKGCVDRVTFRNRPSIQNELPRDGFEWQACEFPNMYCSDGICRPSCVNLDPANTSSNTNSSNSNSNANSNSNSNSNRNN